MPNKIRVSLGSAIVLGLINGRLDAKPTTAYLMTYRRGKCLANCGFCPQARKSRGRADMLSRVSWPAFSKKQVLDGIEAAAKSGGIRRVCIQALNYPQVHEHICGLARAISKHVKVPISVSCQPISPENIRRLAEAGVERIGIPLDAATPEIFDKVKGASAGGPYNMERQLELLKEAVRVFGEGKVSTHLIVGLGESEREMVEMIQKCVDIGVLPALFAFTPVAGTALENLKQPPIQQYRRVQLARHLISNKILRVEAMTFDENGRITCFGVDKQALKQVVSSGEPFRTSGCPDCNRPYYNEKPSGPIYNFPRPLNREEIGKAFEELSLT
ncbi:radical SAM protein [Candidatus Bathyarchaeota archaeon]|nr:radical SAM protein [Candidatus Bathyarchaeota archaeon]